MSTTCCGVIMSISAQGVSESEDAMMAYDGLDTYTKSCLKAEQQRVNLAPENDDVCLMDEMAFDDNGQLREVVQVQAQAQLYAHGAGASEPRGFGTPARAASAGQPRPQALHAAVTHALSQSQDPRQGRSQPAGSDEDG
jgi:hypothetical protein